MLRAGHCMNYANFIKKLEVRQRLAESFPFVDVYYSNRELPSGSSA